MRKNRKLTVAIATVLSLPAIAQAAGGFSNVNTTTHTGVMVPTNACGGAACSPTAVVDAGGVPNAAFNGITSAVVSVPTGGTKYAKELFGDSAPVIPSTANAAALYTVDGDINVSFDISFTLSDGEFSQDPTLAIADSGGDYTAAITKKSGGSNSNTVVYNVNAGSTSSSLSLMSGDQLMLAYQIKDAASLGGDNGKVELSADLKTPFTNILVNPARKVVAALSEQAIEAQLTPEVDGTINISVADESKLFTGEDGAYQNTTTARIGYINIDNKTDVMASDGINAFIIGGSSTDAQTEGSKLEITGGQFAASIDSPGKVELNGVGIQATVSEDGGTATFELEDADIGAIVGAGDKVGIHIVVDSATAINTVENPPQASLLIDFTEDNAADISLEPVDLRQIKKDGTVCVLYNIPNSTALDTLNIRLTNDSSIDGTITAKMYDKDGAAVGPAEGIILNDGNPLGAGKTIRITADQLESAGFSWTKRGIMELTSTLPKLEVLLLLRNAETGILTNLSFGASGSSCNQ